MSVVSVEKSSFLANLFCLGPYRYLIRTAVLGMVLLSLSRLALVLWQYDRVVQTDVLMQLFVQGLRADIIVICLLLVVPVLLIPLASVRGLGKLWFQFSYLWCLSALVLLVFMELATPAFILQYDIRPNRLFVEYLKYPKEVLSTLWFGFRMPLLFGVFATVILSLLLRRIFKLGQCNAKQWSAFKTIGIWCLALLLLFAGIRSTTEHRPANPALFAITSDAMVNSLVLSSAYSVFYAIYNLKHEAHSSQMYGGLPTEHMLKLSLDWPWLKSYQFTNPNYPTAHWQQAVIKREKPLNLVIVLQESLGATFVQSLGGLAVTPELEKLKLQGIWFENLYATGTRSVRGIEAVVAGFPPTPAQSTVKLSNSQQHFTTLASILKSAGYQTQFVYGGEAHFDNMRSFFTGNGVEQIVDQNQIQNPVFTGSWGVSDEDLFTTAHQQLKALHQQEKPFISLIFTSSNHEPFEFPDDRIDLYEEPKNTVNNAVKYADWAMGQFFEKAKQSDYWQDTLFLVVADHDSRVYGDTLIPVDKFHIPGLILGADTQPELLNTLASQIDLAPTLLSMMGLSSCHTMTGRDFTLDKTSPGRALLQFENYFALMQQGPQQQELVILKPDGKSVAGIYQSEQQNLQLSKQPVSLADKNKALALVQLPSYLYREQKNFSEASCI
ncbi:phosphoglycerol transferase family protein, alkaline phosphatase superfamily [Rheinheimera sp. A13L]|uniref:LTA synthase family protein n=1 Tax=Rheinheimera sp. A13L TaxID=506534 RepID=UPI0002125639|nr:LTA synthase family protein [Rheinheimera sp. A13L]EGM77329.1 phosphoglycerol transferase family protein, alkaline phosphatase superfamily [Rheinheimera sp. A13L]